MCWQLAGVPYPNSHIEDRPGGSRKKPCPETFPKISRKHGIQSGGISDMICEQGSDFPGPRLIFYPVIVDLLHHVSVCVFLATFTVSHSRSTKLLPIGKKGIQSLLRVQDLEQHSVSGCPEADQNQWRGAIDPPGSVDPSRLGFTQCQRGNGSQMDVQYGTLSYMQTCLYCKSTNINWCRLLA